MSARLWATPALASPKAAPGHLRQTVLRGLLRLALFTTSIPVSLASPTAAKYRWLLAIPVRGLFRGSHPPEREEPSTPQER